MLMFSSERFAELLLPHRCKPHMPEKHSLVSMSQLWKLSSMLPSSMTEALLLCPMAKTLVCLRKAWVFSFALWKQLQWKIQMENCNSKLLKLLSLTDTADSFMEGMPVKVTTFEPTKRMSTYLLAFIVSDFLKIQSTQNNNLLVSPDSFFCLHTSLGSVMNLNPT